MTTPLTPPDTHPTPSTRRPWLLAWLWPSCCAVVAGVVSYLTIHPAGLHFDDLRNLQEILELPFTESVLLPVTGFQVAPGHRLLYELLAAIGPTDRVVMHGIQAVLVAATVLAGSRAVTRLTRPLPWTPLLLGTILAGPLALTTNHWYAASFHIMPSLFAGTLTILLYARWRTADRTTLPTGRPWVALVPFTLGVLFSPKVALALLLLVLVEYLVLRQGDLETLVVGLWQDRRVWFPFAVPLALYWFLNSRVSLNAELGGAAQILEAAVRGVVRLGGPGIVGLAPAQLDGIEAAGAGFIIASWVVALLAAAVVGFRRPLARTGLVIGVLVLLVGVAMSVAFRVTTFGTAAGGIARYHLDGLVHLVLATSIGVGAHAPSLPSATRLSRTGRRVIALTSAAALLVATAWSVQDRYGDSDPLLAARWIDHAAAELAAARTDVRLLDAPLPLFVSGFPGRQEALEGIVPGLDVSTVDPDWVLAAGPRLERLRLEEVFRQSGAGIASNTLVDLRGDARAVDGRLCTRSEFTLDIVLGAHPAPRYVEVTVDGPAALETTHVPRSFRVQSPPARATTTGPARRLLPLDLRGWVERTNVSVRSAIPENEVCVTEIRFLEVGNDLPGSDAFIGD